MVDSAREKLGITYSPDASALSSTELAGQGYIGVTIETPPTNFGAFHTLMVTQLTGLVTTPVTADELARAANPLIDARTKQFENNDWWITSLSGLLRDPRQRAAILDQANGIRAVTAGDVRTFFARYVQPAKATVIIAKPK